MLYRESEYLRRIRDNREKDQHAAEQKRYDAKRERNIEKIVGAVKAVEEELSRGNNEEYPQQKRDRAWERAGILGLWAAAIVGVIAIWIGNSDSGKQRKVMGGQLVTMQAAQRQTGETIAALTSQAKAMHDQLEEMRTERRAWVGPISARFENDPITQNVGKDDAIIVEIHNSGREPAANLFRQALPYFVTVEEDARGTTAKHISDYVEWCRTQKPIVGGETIFPTTGVSIYNVRQVIGGDLMNWNVLYGRALIIITGCLAYSTLGEPHVTSYCFGFQSGKIAPKALAYCGGNYAD